MEWISRRIGHIGAILTKSRQHPSSPALRTTLSQLGGNPRLHFSLLTQTEKASFEAGLHARLWKRLFEAVTTHTSHEYERTKAMHVHLYVHLLEVLRAESGHAGEPITDDHVKQALERVESDLGESWRHKLEHAINVSQSALQLMARVNEGTSDGHEPEQAQALVWFTEWVGGWVLLNWSIDCIFAATDPRVVAKPEVVHAVFCDLKGAADGVYSTACNIYDARFGDPDDE